MTPLERCLKTIRHEVPDRVPVIPQDAHVGAYLAGLNHLEYATDADKRTAAILEQRARFDFDGVIIGGDTVCLAEAVGVEVVYSREAGPRWKRGRLESYSDIDKLKLPNPLKDGRLPVWVQTVKKVAESIGSDHLVVARADQGAFSLASMMRGMEDFMMDLAMAASEPSLRDGIHRLLQYCNDCQFQFITALQEAGAHVVTTGDSIAGPSVCSPSIYEEYCLPYEKQMVDRCHRIGIPYSIHICGYCEPILAQWLTAGATLWEIDHKTDFAKAREATRGKVTLVGNLDTSAVMYSGTPEMVHHEAEKIINASRPDGGLILSSGCLLAGDTPVENMQALSDAARMVGQY
jgi:uroporphyrinogen decarboxylase